MREIDLNISKKIDKDRDWMRNNLCELSYKDWQGDLIRLRAVGRGLPAL